MLRSISILFAAGTMAVMTGGIAQAAGAPDRLVIKAASGKKISRSDQRTRGAQGQSAHAHYFTREKILKDYHNGAIPPPGVNGPVIYTYRWFDNFYGGRR